MEELTNIIEIDQRIADKEAILKQLKTELDVLKIEREKIAIQGANILEQVGKIDLDGYQFKIQKGRPSVHLNEGVKVENIPHQFIRPTPDKVAMLKAYKTDPACILPFATIETSPDKLTYKLI